MQLLIKLVVIWVERALRSKPSERTGGGVRMSFSAKAH
jgi:hypothetical protein